MRLSLGSLIVGPGSNPDLDLVLPESFSAAVSGANLGLSSSGSFVDWQPFNRWVCFRSSGRFSFRLVGCVKVRGSVFTGAREFGSLTVRLFPLVDTGGTVFGVSGCFSQV